VDRCLSFCLLDIVMSVLCFCGCTIPRK
jgi:hypothetical protein